MYYDLYQAIKQLVATGCGLELDPTTGAPIAHAEGGVSDIQWFKAQYEGVVKASPAVFVEFVALETPPALKQARPVPFLIRLHLVSEATGAAAGEVADLTAKQHDRLANTLVAAVEGKRVDVPDPAVRPLRIAATAHLHAVPGWLVTLIDLQA